MIFAKFLTLNSKKVVFPMPQTLLFAYVCTHLKHLFPEAVSYTRFVELESKYALHLLMFVKTVLLGTCTGISYVDSTPLRVCKSERILQHKTFKG